MIRGPRRLPGMESGQASCAIATQSIPARAARCRDPTQPRHDATRREPRTRGHPTQPNAALRAPRGGAQRDVVARRPRSRRRSHAPSPCPPAPHLALSLSPSRVSECTLDAADRPSSTWLTPSRRASVSGGRLQMEGGRGRLERPISAQTPSHRDGGARNGKLVRERSGRAGRSRRPGAKEKRVTLVVPTTSGRACNPTHSASGSSASRTVDAVFRNRPYN